MADITVERSPVRQLLVGLAGLLLLAAALDIVWMHRISQPPETTPEGQLTARGQAARRSDIIWGSVFLVSGGVLFGVAVTGLLRRKPVVVLTAEGMELALAGPGRRTVVPWSEVVAVRSGHDPEGGGGKGSAVLFVEVRDPSRLPPHPWGAEWRGAVLEIDAEGWAVPPEDVAVHAGVALDRARRREKKPD